MAARRGNLNNLTLHQVYLMATLLIRLASSSSIEQPIVLTGLGGSRSISNPFKGEKKTKVEVFLIELLASLLVRRADYLANILVLETICRIRVTIIYCM